MQYSNSNLKFITIVFEFLNQKNMRKYLFLTILCILTSLTSYGQTMSMQAEQLFEKFKKAARFDYNYPREKVYVHFNSSSYLLNDTIWYKAYVVRASSLKPTTLSRVLYVELLNADGQLITKQTLKIDSMGTAHGAIALPNYAYGGYYEVLAYTREMLNWGRYACFSRVLPVFTDVNPVHKKKKGLDLNLSQLSLLSPGIRKYPTIGKPRPYEMTSNKKRLLDFYPEGGNRVTGAAQRIAFKLTDGMGLATNDSISIYYADGRLCTQAQPEHEGMGTFELPADFTEGYAQVQSISSQKYKLPQEFAQYALRADMEEDGLNIKIVTNKSNVQTNDLFGLAIFNHENACFFDTISLNGNDCSRFVAKDALRSGVNRIELFDWQGHSLSTRLFWKPITAQDSTRFVHLEVYQNQREYKPFSPAVVVVRAKDNKGEAIANANLSFVARDEATTLLDYAEGGISGNMLLASELRGYIHRPDLYFKKNDAAHHHMLDLLMMVQGWSANTFDTMCQKDSFQLWQPIEDKLFIKGTLYSYNKRKPLPNTKVSIKAYGYQDGKVNSKNFVGEAITDQNGNFKFASDTDIYGDYLVQFKAQNTHKGTNTWCKLHLDRWLTPALLPFMEDMMTIHPYNNNEQQSSINRPNNQKVKYFEWTDTILPYKVSNLKAATVHAKRKYKGFTGTRYTWNGGVDNGIHASLTYYNIKRECERFRDFGINDLNLFSFLKIVDLKCKYNNIKDVNGIGNSMKRLSLGDIYFNSSEDYKFDSSNNFERNSANFNETDIEIPSSFNFGEKPQISLRYKKKVYLINNHPYALLLNNEETDDFFDNENNIMCKDFEAVTIVRYEEFADNLSGKYKRNSRGKDADNIDLVDYIYFYERPDEYRTRTKKGVEFRHVQGFTPQIKFYSPNYRKFDLPSVNDIRRTLLWMPQVKTNEKGEATLIFFTNSREAETLDISIRGITKEGQFIDWN